MASKMQVQTKPHIVLVPFPSQGHINPFMQLARLLYSKGCYITFANTEFNHARFVTSKGPDFFTGLSNFRFEAFPDCLPPSDKDATQEIISLCDSLRKNCLNPFKKLLNRLNSTLDLLPVSCVIADSVLGFAAQAARELGIADVKFWTASACGLMGYLQYAELINRGIVPFKDESFMSDGTLETPVDWIRGMQNMRLKDFPSLIRTTDRDDILLNFMMEQIETCFKASTIIINTFEELEHDVLEALRSESPHIYNIGPLYLLEKHTPTTLAASEYKLNLWKEDNSCLEWLDKREPNSVIYVNYGCMAFMSQNQFLEFAWGIANSNHPFLWSVRPDAVVGETGILPDEFYESVKDRGFLTSWCPQDQVLSHRSICAFLTHCGWNSTMESLSNGVPVFCWPFFAEQQTNSRYLCTSWGVGMEINQDVKRDELENVIKEMMETEKGNLLENKAIEWKNKAEIATRAGGSSYEDFNEFIEKVLLRN